VIKIDFWIANLANGATIQEEWLPGYLSPWQRLMDYCDKQNTYLIGLRLVMGDETQSLPPNARGYWQAHGMPSVQGVICDEELHKWRGIGFVDPLEDQIHILWAARDPHTHKTVWWIDQRESGNQRQVIWSGTQTANHLILETDLAGAASVRKVKKFTNKMVDASGGLKEVIVPEHHEHHHEH
jgi:hypothetical protein